MAKTRLTKDMREEIVARVVRATNIPELKADIIARTKAAAVKMVRDAQPEGFYEKTEGLPKEWFTSLNDVFVGYKSALSAFGMNPYIKFDDPVKVAAVSQKYDYGPLESFQDEAKALTERESQLRGEISAFLLSCRHVEDVLERMPELKPHIPGISKSYPLTTASNLLSTLTQLGFDKTVTT